MCQIDVEFFPFDEQMCHLKVSSDEDQLYEGWNVNFQFGSWTYSDDLLELEMLENNITYKQERNENGMVENVSIVINGIG